MIFDFAFYRNKENNLESSDDSRELENLLSKKNHYKRFFGPRGENVNQEINNEVNAQLEKLHEASQSSENNDEEIVFENHRRADDLFKSPPSIQPPSDFSIGLKIIPDSLQDQSILNDSIFKPSTSSTPKPSDQNNNNEQRTEATKKSTPMQIEMIEESIETVEQDHQKKSSNTKGSLPMEMEENSESAENTFVTEKKLKQPKISLHFPVVKSRKEDGKRKADQVFRPGTPDFIPEKRIRSQPPEKELNLIVSNSEDSRSEENNVQNDPQENATQTENFNVEVSIEISRIPVNGNVVQQQVKNFIEENQTQSDSIIESRMEDSATQVEKINEANNVESNKAISEVAEIVNWGEVENIAEVGNNEQEAQSNLSLTDDESNADEEILNENAILNETENTNIESNEVIFAVPAVPTINNAQNAKTTNTTNFRKENQVQSNDKVKRINQKYKRIIIQESETEDEDQSLIAEREPTSTIYWLRKRNLGFSASSVFNGSIDPDKARLVYEDLTKTRHIRESANAKIEYEKLMKHHKITLNKLGLKNDFFANFAPDPFFMLKTVKEFIRIKKILGSKRSKPKSSSGKKN